MDELHQAEAELKDSNTLQHHSDNEMLPPYIGAYHAQPNDR
jgi:hypothetical protein